MVKKLDVRQPEDHNQTFPMFATAYKYRNKDSDYISNLWKQQREFMNKEMLLSKETEQNGYGSSKINGTTLTDINSSHMFKSRVRPAIDRGKTLILAVDPEKHIQLERERLEQLQKRSKPKSPVSLAPIDVKSLQATSDIKPPPASRHASFNNEHMGYSGLMLRTSSEDMWIKQLSIPTIPHKNTRQLPDTLSLHAKLSSSENFNAPQRSQILPKISQTHVSRAGRMIEALKLGEQLHIGKILPKRYDKQAESNQSLTHCKYSPSSSTDSYYRLSDRCCNSTDEDCTICSQYGSRLPIIPFVTQRLLAPDNSSDKGDVAIAPKQRTRRTLVIQLPDINCTPATPSTTTIPQASTTSSHRKHLRMINSQKAQKQKELREKELANLFSDIAELDQVNQDMVSMLHEEY